MFLFAFSEAIRHIAHKHHLVHAGAVCLELRGHTGGVQLIVGGDFDVLFMLAWPEADDQAVREWSDLQEATEWGACGVAVLLIGTLTEYQVVRRSWKGTGFDYWLGLRTDALFQHAARLEVSGILSGNRTDIEKRVRQKLRQVERSERSLPAFVVVVEFGGPLATVVRK